MGPITWRYLFLRTHLYTPLCNPLVRGALACSWGSVYTINTAIYRLCAIRLRSINPSLRKKQLRTEKYVPGIYKYEGNTDVFHTGILMYTS